MSLIDMINEEIYEWEMANNPTEIPLEAYLRIKQLSPWTYYKKGEFEHNSIRQWLYYDEKEYHNWVYNLGQVTEDAKE